MVSKVTLAIGDPHSDPEYPNDRFDALGNFIIERRPDNIVNIGDFVTCDSVSFHDHDKPLFREGRRLKDDLDAGRDAYNRMMAPMNAYNNKVSAWRKRKYNPRKIWHNANHEERVWRYIVKNPELLGFIPHTDLLGVAEDDWELIPYRRYSYVNGIGFTHIPMNKRNSSVPISGEYVARRAVENQEQWVVFGHTHRLLIHDAARHSENNPTTHYGINIGWFGDFVPSYIEGDAYMDWWSGVVLLHHYGHGKVDIETISMSRLKGEYL